MTVILAFLLVLWAWGRFELFAICTWHGNGSKIDFIPTDRGNPNIRATRDHLAFQKQNFKISLFLGFWDIFYNFGLFNKIAPDEAFPSNDPKTHECWDYPRRPMTKNDI